MNRRVRSGTLLLAFVLVSGASIAGERRFALCLDVFQAPANAEESVFARPLVLRAVSMDALLGSRLRLEVSAGYVRKEEILPPSNLRVGASELFLGTALHFLSRKGPRTTLYWGPIGAFSQKPSWWAESGGPAHEQSRTDWYGGVVVGGEYDVTPVLSVAGEWRARYAHVRGKDEASVLAFGSEASLVLRFRF